MKFKSYIKDLAKLFCLLIMGAFCYTSTAESAVRFTLSGAQSDSNLGWQTDKTTAASAGASIDLSEYFRLGYSHRQQVSIAEGLKCGKSSGCEDADYNTAFKSNSRVISNSLEFTLVLYAGDVFTPFIFAGVTNKSFDIITEEEGKEPEHTSGGGPGPSGGLGLSISMTQKFSLTLKHSLSLGQKYAHGEKAQSTLDRQSEVGITYKL